MMWGDEPGILEMDQLTELSMNDNQIQSVPVAIQNLTNLKMLSLARNKLDGVLPIEIWTLPKLTWASFSMNTITQLVPSSFSLSMFTPAPIEQLFVDFNKLTSVPLFPTLSILHAKYNLIPQIAPELVNLTSLVELEIEGNPLPSQVAKMALYSEHFVAYLRSPMYVQDVKESPQHHDDKNTDPVLSYATSEWLDNPSNKRRELVAGNKYKFTVQSMNFYNAPQSEPRPRDCFVSSLHSHKGEEVCKVESGLAGTYNIYVVPTSSGTGMLTVKYDQVHICGSPWVVDIMPGPTVTANCEILEMVDAKRCLQSTFYLVAKDLFGNRKISGGDKIDINIIESLQSDEQMGVKQTTKDFGDGTYAIHFTPTVLGKCCIEIVVNESPLPNAPYMILVGPGPTSAGHSAVVLNELRGAFAGSDCHFTIIPKDEFYNVQPRMEGEIFSTNFVGVAPLQATVVQGPDGTHKVTFHPTVAGKYNAHVSLVKPDTVQIPVAGSPFQIEIVAGPVFAPNCKTEGKGLESGRVGEEGTFRIFAFDKFANPIRQGGDIFEIKIAGPVSTSVSPIDCGDGSYNASYKITKSGSYKISISYKAAQIAGSPFSVALVEGDTHPSKTILAGATDEGICGVATIFTIQAHDVYGNPRKRGGDKFNVSMAPPQLDKIVKGEIKDNGNGTYQVIYTATIAGMYQGEVTLTDLGNVIGSPFRVKQQPGCAFASKCTIQGQSNQTVTAGTNAELVVQLRDQFGNNCESASHTSLEVNIVAKDDEGTSHQIAVSVKDNKNGTITGEYLPTLSGIYEIRASVLVQVSKGNASGSGVINGSPVTVTVAPGPCDPNKVEIYTIGGREGALPMGKCTSPFLFAIRAVDKYGNHRKTGHDVFRVSMTHTSSPSLQPLQGLVTDNNDGTYTVTLTPTTSGVYAVQVVHTSPTSSSTLPIVHSPFQATIEAGVAEASACIATFQKVGVITAGIPAQFQISARDAFFNQRMSGGDRFIAVLHRKGAYGQAAGKENDAIYATVVDCENGLYDVSFTAYVTGDLILSVTLEKGNSQHISGSPINVKVDSSTIDASKCETVGLVSHEPGAELLFQAGVPFMFSVISRDAYSNKTRKGTERMAVTMQGGSVPPSDLSLVDNNDGTYNVTHCVEQSGKYYVSIVVDQVPIQGCPFSLFVNGGPSYAPNCSASGPALATSTSGALSFFIISTKDKYNNIRTVSDTLNIFKAWIQYPSPNLAPPPQQCVVHDNKDGTYRAECTPTLAGECDINVTLLAQGTTTGGQHIFGSPFRAKVAPGSCFPAKCEAFGPGLQGARAGNNVEFTIQMRDYHSNLLVSGGFAWQIKVKTPTTSTVVTPNVQDRKDGTFFCSFCPTVAGKYEIAITGSKDGVQSNRDDDGVHIIGSPFRILITPGDASPHTCKVSGAGVTGGFTGELMLFKIFSCDEFGNSLLVGGDVYEVKVTGPTTPNVLATDNGDGTYQVKYLPNKSGSYLIYINLRSISVPGSPFRCLIEDKPNAN